MSTKEEVVLRASKTSNAKALGSAIARELEKNDEVTCRAIGVQAVNQSVKAIAIAGGFLGQKGKSISTRIGFHNVVVDNNDEGAAEGEEKTVTAINFVCIVTN